MRGRWWAVVAAAGVLLAGCTPTAPAPSSTGPGPTSSAADLGAIAVEIRQDRASWGPASSRCT